MTDWREKYARKMSDYSKHLTQVSETWDDPEPGRSEDEWPYPTTYTTYLAGETMAGDIRKRVGAEPDVPVIVVEECVSGGYSEYTQENDYPFTVRAGGFEKEFDTMPEFFQWLEEA